MAARQNLPFLPGGYCFQTPFPQRSAILHPCSNLDLPYCKNKEIKVGSPNSSLQGSFIILCINRNKKNAHQRSWEAIFLKCFLHYFVFTFTAALLFITFFSAPVFLLASSCFVSMVAFDDVLFHLLLCAHHGVMCCHRYSIIMLPAAPGILP